MIELGALYLAVGIGCAARALWGRRPLDAALLLSLWPLLAPLLLFERRAPGPAPGEGELGARLAAARERLAEIDRALARPELDLARLEERIGELASAGSAKALATARLRARSIRSLAARRKKLADELDELAESLAQLETQSEIARLAGGAEDPVAELAADIRARLEGLEELLEESP